MRKFTLALCVPLVAFAMSALVGAQPFAGLSSAEQQVLAPLSSEWDAMNATRKKKWRELAAKYPSMSPDEQQRISTRMQGWSRMSPDDRRAARDQFRDINGQQKNATPQSREHIKKQWDDYRNLPAEERQRIAQETRARQQQQRIAESVKRSGAPALPSAPAPQLQPQQLPTQNARPQP